MIFPGLIRDIPNPIFVPIMTHSMMGVSIATSASHVTIKLAPRPPGIFLFDEDSGRSQWLQDQRLREKFSDTPTIVIIIIGGNNPQRMLHIGVSDA